MSYLERDVLRKVVIAHESPVARIGAKVGGAAAVALNQSREMHRMGRNVKLIGPRNGGRGTLDIPHELFQMPESTSNEQLLTALKSDEWMSYWEKVFRPDAESQECDVYGHYFVAGDIISQMNGSIRGRKLYMGHSWDRTVRRMDPSRKITPLREKAENSILNNADTVIVSTDAERCMVAEDYQDAVSGGQKAILDKIHVVPLGLDADTFKPEHLARNRQEHRESLLGPELGKTLNFYMVGRIAPQKNQLMAVQAFAETLMADRNLNISLSIYGGPLEGKYYDRIEEFIATQPEEIRRRLKFHGVQDANVAHAVGDVFLGNSVWETFFLAAAEAMASGKPTIISDKPILREVAGEGSLYVKETDVMDTATKIHRMATDEEIRRYSSTYNFNKAWQQYTWEKSARRLDEVWQTLRA